MSETRVPDDAGGLEAYPIDELVDELGRRHKAVVVAAVRDVGEREEGRQVWYRGGWTICVGLAVAAQRYLLGELGGVEDEEDFDRRWAGGGET